MDKSKKPSFFRRKYLINPDFQYPFIIRLVLINLISLLIVYLGIYLIFFRFNFLADELEYESGHRFYMFIKEQFVLVSAIFGGIALTSTITLSIYGLFLSHRIAGPLENIKIRFKRIENKDFENSKTSFRKDDFFHDLANAYNEHVDNIHPNDESNQQDTKTQD